MQMKPGHWVRTGETSKDDTRLYIFLFADDDEYDRPNYSRFSTASYMSAMDASNIRSKKKALCVRFDRSRLPYTLSHRRSKLRLASIISAKSQSYGVVVMMRRASQIT